MKKKITILMATYNGGKYIVEQLNSIINQTYENWELWIRDDLSIDNTLAIIKEYSIRDNRINLYQDDLKNLGATMNFSTLLNGVSLTNYIMFSDQDDIWLPFKIELTLKKMLEVEKANDDKPILIYSELTLVDNNLDVIKLKKFKVPIDIKINDIIAQNFIYGCTMMLNKKLVKLCTPISCLAENHDYWISLIAASYGSIVKVNKPLILYRQHENNVSGSYENSLLSSRIKRLLDSSYQEQLYNKLLMYDAIIKHLNSLKLDTSFIKRYAEIFQKNKFYRLYFITKHRIYKYGSGNLAILMHYISVFNYSTPKGKLK